MTTGTVNWKEFGRKAPCPNKDTIPALVLRNGGKSRKASGRAVGVVAETGTSENKSATEIGADG
jgi:hypothetical protein